MASSSPAARPPRYHAGLHDHADTVRDAVAAGTPYAGFSAGAMIAGETGLLGGHLVGALEVVHEDCSEGLSQIALEPGLGLVPFTGDVHAAQAGTLAGRSRSSTTGWCRGRWRSTRTPSWSSTTACVSRHRVGVVQRAGWRDGPADPPLGGRRRPPGWWLLAVEPLARRARRLAGRAAAAAPVRRVPTALTLKTFVAVRELLDHESQRVHGVLRSFGCDTTE